MAIKIDFLADVNKFLRGTDNIADALDDVAGELTDLERDSSRTADRAGDDLGDAFKDAGRDADAALRKVDDALGDTGTEAKQLEGRVSAAFRGMAADARASGKQIGNSQRRAYDEAGAGLDDLKDESASTAKESAASFDGSADSIIGSFQEIAANAFVGFGPAGLAAGLLAAAGVGVAVSKLQGTAEEADKAQEHVVALMGAIEEAGGSLADVDVAGIIKEWGREVQGDNWLTWWADEAETNFQKYADLAERAGVRATDAIRGMKGAVEDSQGFLDGTTEEWERLNEQVHAGTQYQLDGSRIMSEGAKSAQDQAHALGELRAGAQANIEAQQEAIEVYGIEAEAIGENTAATEKATEAAEAAADAIDRKADALRDSANNALSADESALRYIETLGQMTEDIASNGEGLAANTEVGRANQQSLIDLATAALAHRDALVAEGAGVETVTGQVNSAREAFINQAIAAGHGADAAAALADQYGLMPAAVETLISASGAEETKAAVEAIPGAKDTKVTVAEEGTAEAQGTIDAIEGTDVDATVHQEGAAQVQRDINNIEGRRIPIELYVSNGAQFAGEVTRLTQARIQYVDLVPRKGVAVP